MTTGNRGRNWQWLRIFAVVCSSFAGLNVAEEISAAGESQESVNAWVETEAFTAPEARQAAAADQRFVYAVTNARIGKYDRRTRQLVATSNGAAEHLNSGFLWEGRLYCAHSNYPEQPESSQIKVLDLATMRLEDFHDFGNFGGSLTWAIRRGVSWWCNFARYGEDNSQSFVVQFDERWQEQGRWTYPSEVLNEIGRHSLSGGIWRDDLLCVTDHDHPVLYRLRLPQSGSMLEYVDRLPAPFAGQGIASDPLTGGLVGIERARQRIVFARLREPSLELGPRGPLRLRVLTYNIHHGAGTDGQLDLPRIARVIREVAPDVVALQEVDERANRTGNVDQPAELARLTSMHVSFGANIPLPGGQYGNAVLTRLPIERSENHLLPSLDRGEQRGVLEVLARLPSSRGNVRLFATHLDARGPNHERLASADAIAGLLRKSPLPSLLAGDLNDVPQSAVLQRFAANWTNTVRAELPTSPAGKPRRQIDFVLCAPQSAWRVVETTVLEEPVASDHRPLLVVVELLGNGDGEP